jgi:hypothetical protein
MQNKIDIPTRGVATIFKKDALEFVRSWDKPIVRLCLNKEQSRWEQMPVRKIPKGWIQDIENVAACCPQWPKHMIAQEFTNCYWQLPDLTAALLNFLRQKWAALETSKAGKLKRFLSQNTAVKWVEGFASREAVEEANAIRQILKEKQPHKNIPCPRPVTEEDEKFFQLSQTMWANRQHSGVVPDEFGNVNASITTTRLNANHWSGFRILNQLLPKTVPHHSSNDTANNRARHKFREPMDAYRYAQANVKSINQRENC